jgi:hypothetical protein
VAQVLYFFNLIPSASNSACSFFNLIPSASNSACSFFKESLQTKGIPTEVEGHKGYVGMNDEGVLMEGDKVPEDRRMMEKGDTGDTVEQEKIDLEAEGIRLKKGGCSERMVFRSVAICCWVLPSMVASSPMPLTCPIILTL